MPRSARKSPKEKLQLKLEEVVQAIEQYEQVVLTLKGQKKGIEEELAQLKLWEVLELIREKELSTEGLRDMILNYQPQLEQGA